jgi:hypothetical protein
MTNSDIISLAALVVTFFSFLYVYFHNELQFLRKKKHDVLLNKPIINVQFNRSFREPYSLGIVISNNGLGPAVIIDVIYEFNEWKSRDFSEIILNTGLSDINKLISEIDYSEGNNITGIDEYTLSKNEFLELYKTTISCNDDELYAEEIVKYFISNVTIVVEYDDIFGNEFTLRKKSDG